MRWQLIPAIALGWLAGAGFAWLPAGAGLLLIGLPTMLWLYRRLFFPSEPAAKLTTSMFVATLLVVFASTSAAIAMRHECILTVAVPVSDLQIRW